jgi:hypothetical protein
LQTGTILRCPHQFVALVPQELLYLVLKHLCLIVAKVLKEGCLLLFSIHFDVRALKESGKDSSKGVRYDQESRPNMVI